MLQSIQHFIPSNTLTLRLYFANIVSIDMASLPQAVRLHGYWRSSCSYRIRIILNLKRIPYEYVPVHLLRKEHLSDSHALISPMRSVPVLEIDGVSLSQSGAIALYLEETRSDGLPALMPRGDTRDAALARSRVRAVVDAIGCDVQPLGNAKVLRHVMSSLPPAATQEERDAARDAWSRKWVGEGLDGVESLVSKTAGLCCIGDDVTLADAWLMPQIYNALRVGLAVSERYPTLARIAAHLETLPAFAEAHPSRQPDADA